MADLLGTSYRHLARVMTKFEEEALINKNRKTITILSEDGLRDYAGDLFLLREQTVISFNENNF